MHFLPNTYASAAQRLYGGVLCAILLIGGLLISSTATAQQGNRLLNNIPVTGLVNGNTFDGRLTISDIVRDGSQLVASGVIRGTVNGQNVRQVFQDLTFDLSEGGDEQRCDILFLDIGPIFLDLLGLEVDLSQITLDITAVRGQGNLLGNLLCAVAGLLDGFDLGGTLGRVLDNLLDAINRLL
jgi:hypothetical protein